MIELIAIGKAPPTQSGGFAGESPLLLSQGRTTSPRRTRSRAIAPGPGQADSLVERTSTQGFLPVDRPQQVAPPKPLSFGQRTSSRPEQRPAYALGEVSNGHRSSATSQLVQGAGDARAETGSMRSCPSKLESYLNRRDRSRLHEQLDQSDRTSPPLGVLCVVRVGGVRRQTGSAPKFVLVIRQTRRILIPIVFSTFQFCLEAAIDLEQTFEISGLWGETLGEIKECVESIVLSHLQRELIARSLG